jgi:Fe2+ transport system protein B
MTAQDRGLEDLLNERFFIDHSDSFISSIINAAAETPQQKVSEFTVLLRSIVLPQPRAILTACLVLSFVMGITITQGVEATSLIEELTGELISYEGEIL